MCHIAIRRMPYTVEVHRFFFVSVQCSTKRVKVAPAEVHLEIQNIYQVYIYTSPEFHSCQKLFHLIKVYVCILREVIENPH